MPKTKPPTKAGASIGGLYMWTQRDFNNMMSQLAALQIGVDTLVRRLTALQQAQTTLQGSLQAVQMQVQSSLGKLTAQEAKIMSALDDLTAQVKANTDLEQSAVQAIQGIAHQLQDALNNNDSAALQALAQQLNTSAAALGAAISANTPNAPPSSET